MTLANFKSDFLEFNLTRESKEISGDTIDMRCRILQMQDRAKLLLKYNRELEDRTGTLQIDRDMRKRSDMQEITDIVIDIRTNLEAIEGLIIKTNDQVKSIKTMNDDHLKTLQKMNTDFVVKVEKRSKDIAMRQEELDDIGNWLKHEIEKTNERDQLRELQLAGKQKHEQEMDNIKKERALAIDKLRKEMLMKIRNVKNQMLSMNED